MKKYKAHLVRYEVGNIKKEVELQVPAGDSDKDLGLGRKLVLIAHDEMTDSTSQ
jgi:hypothetical protein